MRKLGILIRIFLCVCIGCLTIGCGKQSATVCFDLAEAEKNSLSYTSELRSYDSVGREREFLYNCDTILVGTIIGHETMKKETTDKMRGYEAVAHIVQVSDVLLGDYELGDQIYVGMWATVENDIYYPDRDCVRAGGFMQEGETVLLFTVDNPIMVDYYGNNQYKTDVICNYNFAARTVSADGTLTFRENNVRAEEAPFAQYSTVQQIRDALPQLLQGYRDKYKRDHKGVATYHVYTGAPAAVPEEYVYYADLPQNEVAAESGSEQNE